MVAINSLNSCKNSNQIENAPIWLKPDYNKEPFKTNADFTKENDEILDGTAAKIRATITDIAELPDYFTRGFKGDPDVNFAEFLKMSKVPYYIGGLGLVATYMIGCNKFLPSAVKSNQQLTKRVLGGVLLYYAARWLADAAINTPLSLMRGIDLNRPYIRKNSLSPGNPDSLPANQRPCNQKVYESCEFTRWDLLYDYSTKNGYYPNRYFDKLAKKFGAETKQKDSDSRVVQKVKETIKMANAWKYALTIPFVTTALGFAQQKSFTDFSIAALKQPFLNLFNKEISNSGSIFKDALKLNLWEPLKKSGIEMWKGTSKTSKIVGRTAIIGSVAMTLLANAMILIKSSSKEKYHHLNLSENRYLINGEKKL